MIYIVAYALLLCVFGTVCAIKEFSLEELDCNDSKDEHEELVDNEDVEDVLQGGHHTVEDSLELGQALDGLQWPKNSEDPQRFDGLDVSPLVCSAAGRPPEVRGQGEK